MGPSIRNRLIVIAILIVASIVSLIPRDVKVRTRGNDGLMRDTTERRVPLKYGLDLQGGMHLALELDQSKKVSADPAKDIRALSVIDYTIRDGNVIYRAPR